MKNGVFLLVCMHPSWILEVCGSQDPPSDAFMVLSHTRDAPCRLID